MPAAAWLMNLDFAGSVSAVVPPVISTTALDPATEGVFYTQTLVATSGTTPYTWSISIGALPAGLTLDASTGVISGIPTVVRSTTFTVLVTDDNSQTDTQELTITVIAADPNRFGVWERVPIAVGARASSLAQGHQWARARVATLGVVRSLAVGHAVVASGVSHAIQASVQTHEDLLPVGLVKADIMPYNEFEDWIVLLWKEEPKVISWREDDG